MKSYRRFLRRLPFYGAIKSISHYPDYWYWKLRIHPGRTPHLMKQRALREYAKKYGLRVLIETGTYYGEMVAALKNRFDRIFSVECEPELARRAARKFASESKIQILEGESQQALPELLQSLTEAALFWLDAGYYTWDGLQRNKQRLPMELGAILGHKLKGHVVLIDDASTLKFCADDRPEPTNITELQSRLAAAFPDRLVEIRYDIVRITPRSS
jgi:hypothetical protein